MKRIHPLLAACLIASGLAACEPGDDGHVP